MSDKPLVQVEGVGKRFCRSLKRSLWYGVHDICSDFNPLGNGGATGAGRTTLRKDEFWALDDISFELKRGECLGLIGRNGAGKTTMLRVLNNLIKPDFGRVLMRGRVGALIALGAGFNPILTGRENVHVYGSVLGFTKREIDAKMEDIIDFAEIRDFIDAPVQTYSSGMHVRLGFAVASSMSPDVLLVDEVLAVGDMIFRAKCFRRIDELRRSAAVILVSHQMDMIGVACDRVLVMDHGRAVCDGSTAEGIEAYERLNQASGEHEYSDVRRVAPPLKQVEIQVPPTVAFGGPLRLVVNLNTTDPIPDFYMRFKVFGPDAKVALEIISSDAPVDVSAGQRRIVVESQPLFLRPGSYLLSAGGHSLSRMEPFFQFSRSYRFEIKGKPITREAYVHVPASLVVDDAPSATKVLSSGGA